jgi:ACS family hexuronate transporter-like MFS transporter
MPHSVARTPAKAWGLCIFLFLATALNYLDRQTMSILAPTIQREMALDNVALGWLFSVFYYSYTFAQFAVGVFLDRANLRWAFAIAVVAWSTAAGLTGLSTGFAGLFLFRLLLGLTESANWPAAMRIVARLLPPRDRSLGNGIFTSGTSVGALIAPSLILGIAALVGWRWAFVAVGSFGFLWAGAWLLFTRDPLFAHVWQDASPQRPAAAPAYAAILRSSRFWRVFAVAILVNPCLYFNVNWLPTYFAQQRGMQPGREVGIALTIIYLGLDLGYLACGFGVRQLSRRRSVTSARRIVFLAATVLMGLSAVAPLLPSVPLTVAALALVNLAVGAWIAMYLTMGQEVSKESVSTAAGLLGGSGSLAGALAMWGVGKVTQHTGSFTIPMACVSLAALCAAFAGMFIRAQDENPPR